jgi:hypothetical protein
MKNLNTEYRTMIRKAALDNPDLPVSFIRHIIVSLATDRSLAEPFIPEGDHPYPRAQ